MQVVIVSGRSGSGKTTALHVLEDIGFYCVDNLPVGLLPQLTRQLKSDHPAQTDHLAVGVDARNAPTQLANFINILRQLDAEKIEHQIVFLDADDHTLLKRFSETRRKHPISDARVSLPEAIQKESEILHPISSNADLNIDTSHLSLHDLRDLIKKQFDKTQDARMAILFQSFGFKVGVPPDTDLMFDVRCLPNPHWIRELRALTGLDQDVIDFLVGQDSVNQMTDDIEHFLRRWLPQFEQNNRSYMTVAIGCTGGQHRSVYIAQTLTERFSADYPNVQVRHRELM